MTSPPIRKKSSSNFSHHWEKQTNVITYNDVLEAYLKGKEAGKTEQQRVNQSLFNTNLEKLRNYLKGCLKKLVTSA